MPIKHHSLTCETESFQAIEYFVGNLGGIMSLDVDKYQKAIPDCCVFQTIEEHFKYLLMCWGVLSAIERNEPMLCWECGFATRKIEVVEKNNG